MATVNTWTLLIQAANLKTANNPLWGLLNGDAGGRVLRIRRIGMLNVTGGTVSNAQSITLRHRYSGAAWGGGPSAVAPIAHDTTNSALDTVTAGWGGSFSGGTEYIIFNWYWDAETPLVDEYYQRGYEIIVPWNIMWQCGYGNGDAQPLTLRSGAGTEEAGYVYNATAAHASNNVYCDVWGEFTDEAS